MGLFSNLFGGKKAPKTPPKPLELPITREFLDGKLKVHISYHQLAHVQGAKGRCLLYRTEGLMNAGQKEMILVQRDPKGVYTHLSDGLVKFFEQAYHFAEKGQTVDVGETTEFGGPVWGDFQGFYYVQPEEQFEALTQAPTLQMIFLTQKEIKAVQYFGHLRIQAMFGNAYRYYPTPYWSDLGRKKLPIDKMAEQSVVSRIDRMYLHGGSVVKKGEAVYIRVPKNLDLSGLGDIDLKEVPLAILPDLAPDADACLAFTFDPKSMGPPAIAPPGSTGQCASACALCVLPAGEHLEIRHFEDGLNVTMKSDDVDAFWNAVKTQAPFEVQGEKGAAFVLEWI